MPKAIEMSVEGEESGQEMEGEGKVVRRWKLVETDFDPDILEDQAFHESGRSRA